ncbi:hypothetical protein M2275_006883 [Rhodococcus opacus]|nr:hypothetical protein [Rhodococcus opacus]
MGKNGDMYPPQLDWLPPWAYPLYAAGYGFFWLLRNGYNPLTGYPW